MNKLRPTFKLVLCISIASILLASCSDDDNKSIPAPPEPSRVISRIEVRKIADVINYQGDIKFTYDNNNRLTRIHNSSPLATVNYTYSGTEVSYSYSSEHSPLVEISTSLENGRSYVCKFSNQESPITYSYDNDGYLKSSNNNGIVLTYSWSKDNLASITSTPRGAYNSDYKVSTITNDYSLDLNTLAQWIDDRENYTDVVNTFGQMAGILGKRSAHLVEDTYYLYDYSFRQDGRLKDITLIGSNKTGYCFRLHYTDDGDIE